jgi:hypothetical protein
LAKQLPAKPQARFSFLFQKISLPFYYSTPASLDGNPKIRDT